MPTLLHRKRKETDSKQRSSSKCLRFLKTATVESPSKY